MKKVGFVGCGGIGSNVAFSAAGNGIQNFILIDNDTINHRNVMLSSPYYKKDIGRYKSEVLAERLLEKYPLLNVKVYTCWDYQVPMEVLAQCDLLVLGVDSNAARQRVNWFNTELKKPMVNIGFDGWGAAYTLFIPGKTACWSCLFRPKNIEQLEDMNKVHQCPQPEPNIPGGVIKGTLDQLSGFAAKQILKIFTGIGRIAQYHAFDSMTEESITVFLDAMNYLHPDPECPVCTQKRGVDIGKL